MCETEDFKSYLSNLEEYVFDENKVVSAGWLSRTLQIHISLANKVLSSFTKSTEFKDKLSTTWAVYGTRKDTQNDRTLMIIPDTKLSDIKIKLDKIISQNIYSVEKYKEEVDLNTVYLAEQSCETPVAQSHSLSNIQYNHFKIIENRRNFTKSSKSDVNVNVPQNGNKSYTNASQNSNKSSTNIFSNSSKSDNKTITISAQINSNKISPKKNSVEKKNDEIEKKEEKKNSPEINKSSGGVTAAATGKKNAKNLPGKGSGNIASFFSKGPLPPMKEPEVIQKEKNKTKLSSPVEESKEADENTNPETISNIEEIEESKSKKGKHNKKEIKSSKKNNENKEESNKKKEEIKRKEKKKEEKQKKSQQQKRKRIQVVTDSSESETEEAEERELSPPPPSPSRVTSNINMSDDDDEVIPATPEPIQNGRKRKRKLISKTMTDESGFLRTVKEFETVSCSDSDGETTTTQSKSNTNDEKIKQEVKKVKVEEINNTKKSPHNQSNKKSTAKQSPSKSKQTSILSFFTKKS